MKPMTAQIKQAWAGDAPYYTKAEAWMGPYWEKERPFKCRFDQLNIRRVLELACGRGRHVAHLLATRQDIEHYIAVDINEPNIEAVRARVGDDPRVRLIVNNGSDLRTVADASLTAVFSYDSMVHFEYDDVIDYVKETHRVLEHGGRAFLHHSNNDRQPGTHYVNTAFGRNFMSADLFQHAAMRAGFTVLEQELMDWNGCPRLDCLTLLEKP